MRALIMIFIVFQIGNTYGQQTSELKLLGVKELRNDLDSLTKYIEETHPNAFFKFPKDKFYKMADSIKSVITKPLNCVDYYILVEPLIAKLEDGHTAISFPQIQMEYFKLNLSMFPYDVILSDKEPFIRVI